MCVAASDSCSLTSSLIPSKEPWEGKSNSGKDQKGAMGSLLGGDNFRIPRKNEMVNTKANTIGKGWKKGRLTAISRIKVSGELDLQKTF